MLANIPYMECWGWDTFGEITQKSWDFFQMTIYNFFYDIWVSENGIPGVMSWGPHDDFPW